MSALQATTVLITGASRGLGKAFLEAYLIRPNHVVIATVRDLETGPAKSLLSLAKAADTKLVLLKLDSAIPSDAKDTVHELTETYHITHLDLVISNAGLCNHFGPLTELPLDTLNEHISINAMAPLVLFQATVKFLKNSKQPKFVVMGSPIGSVGGMEMRPFELSAYGGSKALAHYFTRKMHCENEWLIAFVADPGFVGTEMGVSSATALEFPPPTLTAEESTAGVIKIIDEATKEKFSGHFMTFDGTEFPW